MKLDMMTWQAVEREIHQGTCLILPTGSTEQHGPMGFIGTDRICAEAVACRAADLSNVIVAPALAYTPAPFNMSFGGTMSVSAPVFESMVSELLAGAFEQGFLGVYVVNGHGANIAPVRRAAANWDSRVKIRSWWDFDEVERLRAAFYGSWEGMHATPSEIAITQHVHFPLPSSDALNPPRPIDRDFLEAHAGDNHGPPEQHRAEFPDGRVGSHSALARPDQGEQLLNAAAEAVARDVIASFPSST